MHDELKQVDERDLSLLPLKFQVMFAVFCAKQIEPLWKDAKECVYAMELVEGWLNGENSGEECRNSAAASFNAYYTASYSANGFESVARAALAVAYVVDQDGNDHYTTAFAAYSSTLAIRAAIFADYKNVSSMIEAQWKYYHELLHFDDIAEDVLLGFMATDL